MADDELENDGLGKKPLLRYLLLGAAAFFVGSHKYNRASK